MAAAPPYMPLYVNDYLADCSHLTTRQHGAYLLLLMAYWQRGKPLPNDDEKLARICRMRLADWKRDRDVLCELFEVSSSGWTQNRVEHELQRVRDKSLKNSKAGSTSAQRRLNKRSTNVDQTFNHTDTDTDTDIPIDKSIGQTAENSGSDDAVPDIRKAVFDGGVSLLGKAGYDARQARSMIGRWLKENDEADVLRALGKAQREGALEPVAFIQGIFRHKRQHEPEGKYEGFTASGVAYLP